MGLERSSEGASPYRGWTEKGVGSLPLSEIHYAQPACNLPDQPPVAELFAPARRNELLEYLVNIQFPALRDLMGKLLQAGYFLLDPVEVTFQLVKRLIVEADQFNPHHSYWGWVQQMAAQTIHHCIMEDDVDLEKNSLAEPKQGLQRAFNQLPLEQRRALYLVGVMGFTIEDAAKQAKQEPGDICLGAHQGLQKLLSITEKGGGKEGAGHE